MSDRIKTGSSARVKGGVGNTVLPGNGMTKKDVTVVRVKRVTRATVNTKPS